MTNAARPVQTGRGSAFMDHTTSKRYAAASKMRKPRSKTMLLPMNAATVRAVSMDRHLTLEVLRSGHATEYHLGSMAQATYLAMLLSAAGYGVAREGLFRAADEAIARSRDCMLANGVWAVDEEGYALLSEVLTLHDHQLVVTPVYELMAANEKLKNIAVKPSSS
jgi:hypothetical protein